MFNSNSSETKLCLACRSEMKQVPLFTSMYWDCPQCDHPENQVKMLVNGEEVSGFMSFEPLLIDGEGIPSDLNSHINHGWSSNAQQNSPSLGVGSTHCLSCSYYFAKGLNHCSDCRRKLIP